MGNPILSRQLRSPSINPTDNTSRMFICKNILQKSISGRSFMRMSTANSCEEQKSSWMEQAALVTMPWYLSGQHPGCTRRSHFVQTKLVSCGMDACEHEYESMSRHNRKVPSSFYYRFAKDTCLFSEKYARGRVVSVLEGGYSDRALISGTMAHMCGLIDLPPSVKLDEDWWSLENLIKVSTFL